MVTVLHDLNFAVNYADLLVFLKQGRIAGTISDNDVCSPELIKRVFDVDVQMSINPQTGKPFFMPFRARRSGTMSVAILLSARRRPARLALLLLTLLLIAASLVHLGLGARWIARRRCCERCWSTIRATLSSGLSSICVWCGWRRRC
nr:Probable siderophore transport system ATP-binding protein YusV [Klebsiella pneumoniae]